MMQVRPKSERLRGIIDKPMGAKIGLVTISAASTRSGVTSKMIRYYEQLDLLPNTERTAGGYRLYSEADIRRLRIIHLLSKAGMRVADIKVALATLHSLPAGADRRNAVKAVTDVINQSIARMQTAIKAIDDYEREML